MQGQAADGYGHLARGLSGMHERTPLAAGAGGAPTGERRRRGRHSHVRVTGDAPSAKQTQYEAVRWDDWKGGRHICYCTNCHTPSKYIRGCCAQRRGPSRAPDLSHPLPEAGGGWQDHLR